MLALSIRQPHAELILRGIKRIEYRSRATKMIGRRFWIYAAGTWPPTPAARRDIERAVRVWSQDLVMPGGRARGQRSEIRGQAEPEGEAEAPHPVAFGDHPHHPLPAGEGARRRRSRDRDHVGARGQRSEVRGQAEAEGGGGGGAPEWMLQLLAQH